MSGALGTSRVDRVVDGHDGWVRAWPLRKPAVLALAKGGAVLLFVVWTAIGVVFMQFLDDGPVGDADRRAARWLEDRRTSTWNSLSHIGSMLSDTIVKVALVVVVGGVMVIVWRRWHDAVFLAMVVSLEAAVFVIVSLIVGRDRPPVEQLDPPAPSGSFPSGHAAAAVAFYTGLFVVVRWHTRNRAIRPILGVVAVAVPVAVAASRAYRGMHHLIDVAAGLLLGLTAIALALAAVRVGVAEIDRTADESVPDRVRRLDVTSRVPVTPDGSLTGVQR